MQLFYRSGSVRSSISISLSSFKYEWTKPELTFCWPTSCIFSSTQKAVESGNGIGIFPTWRQRIQTYILLDWLVDQETVIFRVPGSSWGWPTSIATVVPFAKNYIATWTHFCCTPSFSILWILSSTLRILLAFVFERKNTILILYSLTDIIITFLTVSPFSVDDFSFRIYCCCAPRFSIVWIVSCASKIFSVFIPKWKGT